MALSACKDKDQAADWSKAEKTPLKAKLAERRAAREGAKMDPDKVDKEIDRFLGFMVKTRKHMVATYQMRAAASGGLDAEGRENLAALNEAEAGLFADLEKMKDRIVAARDGATNPAMVDRVVRELDELKTAYGK